MTVPASPRKARYDALLCVLFAGMLLLAVAIHGGAPQSLGKIDAETVSGRSGACSRTVQCGR